MAGKNVDTDLTLLLIQQRLKNALDKDGWRTDGDIMELVDLACNAIQSNRDIAKCAMANYDDLKEQFEDYKNKVQGLGEYIQISKYD